MKTFTASLIALVLLTSAIIANSCFITSFTNGLIEDAEMIDPGTISENECRKAVEAMEKKINGSLFLISLSVGHDETEDILDKAESLKNHIGDDVYDFSEAKSALIRSLKKLKKSESLCADGIF